MKHLFFTGPAGVGKTETLRRYLALRGAVCSGFHTVWCGDGLHILPFDTPQTACTLQNRAAVRWGGSCHADSAVFDAVGVPLLHGDWIIMDELGFLETDSSAFQAAVFAALDSGAAVAGVIKSLHTPFLDAVRAHPQVAVIVVTPENRDELPARLLAEL